MKFKAEEVTQVQKFCEGNGFSYITNRGTSIQAVEIKKDTDAYVTINKEGKNKFYVGGWGSHRDDATLAEALEETKEVLGRGR